ncbi:hypothetical protein SEA_MIDNIGHTRAIN_45 [Arthrobacter phage MidnightRain]|nr:hypothetical protein SEA_MIDNIGHTRAIN_45 [Arthrobacter phage MidnightRain]
MSALDEIRARIPEVSEAKMSRAERDRARLLAAAEAVLALHEPGPGYHIHDVACQTCSNSLGYSLYPCPTVAALTSALDGPA